MNAQLQSYRKAKKKVAKIKRFYQHLCVFGIVNVALLIIKWRLLALLVEKGHADSEFLFWVDWNIIATPLIWGVVLFVHWLSLFKLLFLKNWERRQIQKYMRSY